MPDLGCLNRLIESYILKYICIHFIYIQGQSHEPYQNCFYIITYRARTKKIYTMTSRKSKKELYEICKELKVQYIVYEGGWCVRNNAG